MARQTSVDPLLSILLLPEKFKPSSNLVSIVPSMTQEEERQCLAEIKEMGKQVSSWRRLNNGMAAGEFAYLYVRHFRHRRNYRPQYLQMAAEMSEELSCESSQ